MESLSRAGMQTPVQFALKTDNLDFMNRFTLLRKSDTYNVITAFFTAIGKLSKQSKEKILEKLNGMGKDKITSLFGEFVEFANSAMAESETLLGVSVAANKIAAEAAKLAEQIQGKPLTIEEKAQLEANVENSESIKDATSAREKELHTKKLNGFLEAYNGGKDPVTNYRRFLRYFFSGQPFWKTSASASEGIHHKTGLDTPMDSEFFRFENGKFASDQPNFEKYLTMANQLKAQCDIAWEKEPLVRQYAEQQKNPATPLIIDSKNLRDLNARYSGSGHALDMSGFTAAKVQINFSRLAPKRSTLT
jgi:hypothetical protein